MIKDQVEPLPESEGDNLTLTERISSDLLSLSIIEEESSSNSSSVFGEDVRRARCLMAAYLMPGGKCLRYILERRAFTSPHVSQATGVDINLVYGVVARLVRSGVAWERYRVGGQGRPATVYALFDASEDQVREAAALYRDSNMEHVRRLDDYAVHAYEETYRRVAEEAVRSHVDYRGRVDFPSVVKLLSESGLYGEPHLHEMRQTLNVMGYSVIS